MRFLLAAGSVLAALLGPACAADTFVVHPAMVTDEKPVFATVESLNVEPARVRTGGTIVRLTVQEGDAVARDQVVAVIADAKLLLQQQALEAQIAGAEAQLAQAQRDMARTEALEKSGAGSRLQRDQAETAARVADTTLRARIAERAVVTQQMTEGEVLAPTAGRVLKVPVTLGTVVLAGEPVAMIAEQDYALRLRVPEHYARTLKSGDPLRLDAADLQAGASGEGRITLVYPQIQDGRVIADARVAGLGDYFVGQRVQVWIAAGTRPAIIVPQGFILTRFGLDYARLRQKDGGVLDVPVQRGRAQPMAEMPGGLEILTGLHDGDVLVQP